MSFRNLVSLVASSLLLPGLTWPECAAQAPPSVGAVVLAVSEPDDPLRIVEFSPRRQIREGPYTVLRNFSGRPIAGFRLLAAMSAPAECLSEAETPSEGQATESRGRYSDRGFEHTSVPAGSSVRVYWNLLGPLGLVWHAKGLKSSYAQFQVWVSKVEFQDGTLWKRSEENGAILGLDVLRKATPTNCQPWKQMNESLAEVTEVQSRPDATPGHPLSAPDGVSFVFSCCIVGHDAVCPSGSLERR